MDESYLIKQSQGGDAAAFNYLVETYQQRIYNLSLRMMGNSESAEDATQEAFLNAFRAIRSFRSGSFKAWLFRIATNVCYDQLRSNKRRPATSLDELILDPENPIDFPDSSETPEDYALRSELGRSIQQGLLSMSPDHRAVLVLIDIQGMSYDEVAEITNTQLGTIKSRLSRARRHLRDFLLQQEHSLASHRY